MLGHVTPIGTGVAFATEHMQEHVLNRHAQRVSNRLLPVVWEKPVMSWLHEHDRPHLNLLVAARRSKEGNFALSSENFQPFLDVIDAEHLLEKLLYDGIRNNSMIRINPKIGWRFHMLSAHRINPLY